MILIGLLRLDANNLQEMFNLDNLGNLDYICNFQIIDKI